MSNSPKDKIHIFHRLNRLKLKAGAELDDTRTGFLDPLAVYRAQKSIDEKAGQYGDELEQVLVKIESSWADLQAAKNPKDAKRARNHIFNYANNIKDLASTYNYELMDYFGKSLRDFADRIDPAIEAHKVIVQAHIDVMWVTFHHGIKEDEGPLAQELKDIITKAIAEN